MNDFPCNETARAPLWRLLFHAAGRVETRFETELNEVGLSISKMGMLEILVNEGEPIPLSRLAGKLACVKSNVTQLVDRLESDGMVARINDPSDRRSILASITEAGRARYEDGAEAVRRVERELFGDVSAEDYERVVVFLRRFTSGDCGQ